MSHYLEVLTEASPSGKPSWRRIGDCQALSPSFPYPRGAPNSWFRLTIPADLVGCHLLLKLPVCVLRSCDRAGVRHRHERRLEMLLLHQYCHGRRSDSVHVLLLSPSHVPPATRRPQQDAAGEATRCRGTSPVHWWSGHLLDGLELGWLAVPMELGTCDRYDRGGLRCACCFCHL
jgi:hypothetical protein